MSFSKIRIGVYGASGSGKTSFFYHLVKGNALPVAPGSKLAQFMAAATAPNGGVIPTTSPFDNVSMKIDRVVFETGDWKGEQLAQAVDRLDLERRRGRSRNLVVRQIARSDVFFFFYDPTGPGSGDVGGAQKHHNTELLRAKRLIDYILESRQNRLLPILFILGHQDQVRLEPERVRMMEKWIHEVDQYVEESFSQFLLGYYPRPLARKENIIHHVTATAAGNPNDLLEVMESAHSLIVSAAQFRERDRRRSFRLVVTFLVCTLLVLLLPLLCLASPTVKQLLLRVHDKAAPMFEKIPSFQNAFTEDVTTISDAASELEPLWNVNEELNAKNAVVFNKYLFFLMKRLNRLEDESLNDLRNNSQNEAKEYQNRLAQWLKSWDAIEKRFDRGPGTLPIREHLEIYAALLSLLTDSPNRETKALNNVLQKYWQRYRQTLADELRGDIRIYREANATSADVLDELCKKLDRAFRAVAESRVRGALLRSDPGGTADENQKELLKQDLRKAFIALRNYSSSYPVEIKTESAVYTGEKELDRDFHYRLVFYGGKEDGEVYVDLTPSPGVENTEPCSFLPSKKDITLPIQLDHKLRIYLQRKPKGNEGNWERIMAWQIGATQPDADSLETLGIYFYLRYENEENTKFVPEHDGFRFEFIVRRPRNVPDFLWEFVPIIKNVSSN